MNQVALWFLRHKFLYNLNVQTWTFSYQRHCNDRLFGNPVCNPDDPLRPVIACIPRLHNWKISFGTCANKTCSNGLTFNTGIMNSCNCVDPFQVLLECRRPIFSGFTDSLMQDLQSRLCQELGLDSQQVMVEKANFTSDGRAHISINFFSANGDSPPDKNTTSNITRSLSTQLLTLPGFKPYILLSVELSYSFIGKPPDVIFFTLILILEKGG